MTMLSRRDALRQAAALSVGFGGLQALVRRLEAAPALRDHPARGYGPLVPDPRGVMDLPRGFAYTIFSRTGDRMDDGLFVPALHDGMAAFPGPDGLTVLVRNHEISPAAPRLGPWGWSNELLDRIDPDALYDPGVDGNPKVGGTTTLVYDTRRQTLRKHFLSLSGTSRNCAGGPTPWGTWITCEETEERAGEENAADHGYNFEVPARPDAGLTKAVPLRDMGRFSHEAVAVAPDTGIVYQTEDRHDGLIYRYLPDVPGELARGGRLQALAILDQPARDTRNWPRDDGSPAPDPLPVGGVVPVRWLDLEDVESPNSDLRFRGYDAGAARFARGEGMWYGRKSVFFACTNGGGAQKGQIWRYVPSPFEGTAEEQTFPGRLELFVESAEDDLLRYADNLTVAPTGDLVIAEDGRGRDRLIGITPQGEQYEIAANVFNTSELAGVTFSPDGSTLFVNMQSPGLTLAITGPWSSR